MQRKERRGKIERSFSTIEIVFLSGLTVELIHDWSSVFPVDVPHEIIHVDGLEVYHREYRESFSRLMIENF